ncbi:MAG: hypothetical protein AAGE59_29710 [Cyanobacteria bacterium P01_F01_bin.86]
MANGHREELQILQQSAKALRHDRRLHLLAEYCDRRIEGVRKEALQLISDFVSNMQDEPIPAKRGIATQLLEIWFAHSRLETLMPYPLVQGFLLPTLHDWIAAEPNNAVPRRWLGLVTQDPSVLEEALQVARNDPTPHGSALVELLRGADYGSVHRECLNQNLTSATSRIAFTVPPAWRDIVIKLDESGSVVDIGFISAPPNLGAAELHYFAALEAMRLFQSRIDCYFAYLAQDTGTDRSDYWSISIDTEALVGKMISVDEFIGAGYQINHGVITAVETSQPDEPPGLGYAVCEPPHGTSDDSMPLLTELVTTLFSGFSEPHTIYQWNSDWSNYFDHGKEWWGTFFWTVHLPQSQVVVGMGASTTD